MKKHLKSLGTLVEDVNLENFNTYKIKKKVKYLFSPHNVENLIDGLKIIKENNIRYILIGNGSNIILSDKYFDGVVIKLNNLNDIKVDNKSIHCEAGVMMPTLVMEAINHNLKGLEWAFGIPGNVGGSVAGNAGAYNACIFEYIKTVTFLDEFLEVKTYSIDKLDFDYRYSIFKEMKDWIILSVILELEPGHKKESQALIQDRLQRRKDSQPLEYPSAGSVFRNPENNFAGKLIEDLGFKDKNIGGAFVSKKHANFIINKNNATGSDIRNLIELIKKEVAKEYNIDLILEQEYIDW